MSLANGTNTSNHPDVMLNLVGETIRGVMCDNDGRWLLIVESGHALILSDAKFWTLAPSEVQKVARSRMDQLNSLRDALINVTHIEEIAAGKPG